MPAVDTISAEAVVIGAGPAGSAAALTLARRGVDVLLVDRSAFPREKVCGDALIPDALAALAALGVRDEILAHSLRSSGIKVYAPHGREVALHGECAVVPRFVLDDTLRAAAIASGARFLAPYRVIEPIVRQDHFRHGSSTQVEYAGARFRDASGRVITVLARWTILATGAAGEALRAFGVADRAAPSATAARVYMHAPAAATSTSPFLLISFGRQLAPGYGWVFPGPDGMFNVGVGIFHDATRKPGDANLRAIMTTFLETFEPARALARAASSMTRFVGAPLRTGLMGSALARPGLLVAGEAAGATYSFSGEGIGKALETGMLAGGMVADALANADRSGDGRADAVAAAYVRRAERRFRERFRAYQLAQRYLAHPAVVDFLAWRANAGSFVRAQLEGIFNETADARQLFSPGGLVRALLS